jgi:hypothetical protein
VQPVKSKGIRDFLRTVPVDAYRQGVWPMSRKVTANLFRMKDSYLFLAVNDEK